MLSVQRVVVTVCVFVGWDMHNETVATVIAPPIGPLVDSVRVSAFMYKTDQAQ